MSQFMEVSCVTISESVGHSLHASSLHDDVFPGNGAVLLQAGSGLNGSSGRASLAQTILHSTLRFPASLQEKDILTPAQGRVSQVRSFLPSIWAPHLTAGAATAIAERIGRFVGKTSPSGATPSGGTSTEAPPFIGCASVLHPFARPDHRTVDRIALCHPREAAVEES